MLTVEEAARVLRIGRTHAYALTTRYVESGRVDGIPVLRLGGVLRVPKPALLELVTTGRVAQLLGTGERGSSSTTPLATASPAKRSRQRPAGTQLALLSGDRLAVLVGPAGAGKTTTHRLQTGARLRLAAIINQIPLCVKGVVAAVSERAEGSS